jgi:hypothetical protein
LKNDCDRWIGRTLTQKALTNPKSKMVSDMQRLNFMISSRIYATPFDENVYFALARKYMEFEQALAIANHTFNHKIARPLRYPNSDRALFIVY